MDFALTHGLQNLFNSQWNLSKLVSKLHICLGNKVSGNFCFEQHQL